MPARCSARMPRWLSVVLLFGTVALHARPANADQIAWPDARASVADGDLIFQESRSAQSAAVQAATGSRYSHAGLVFGVAEGRPYVIEAVQPVQRTPLATWIRRGDHSHFVLMRLRERPVRSDLARLKREAELFLGLDYDPVFDWSNDRMYCSELVWKAYERAWKIRLAEPEPWRSLQMDDPHVLRLAKQRLGRIPDLDAPVITPTRLMQSTLLVRVLAGELR